MIGWTTPRVLQILAVCMLVVATVAEYAIR